MTGVLEILVFAVIVYGLYRAVRVYLWWHRNDCPRCGVAPHHRHLQGCRHVPERVRR